MDRVVDRFVKIVVVVPTTREAWMGRKWPHQKAIKER